MLSSYRYTENESKKNAMSTGAWCVLKTSRTREGENIITKIERKKLTPLGSGRFKIESATIETKIEAITKERKKG